MNDFRRYGPPGGWTAWHKERAAATSRAFGGFDEDVLQAFFALAPANCTMSSTPTVEDTALGLRATHARAIPSGSTVRR